MPTITIIVIYTIYVHIFRSFDKEDEVTGINAKNIHT